MLLTEVTSILKVLLGVFGAVASRDDLTQRRIGEIGEVIGAVDDVAADEEEKAGGGETIAQKRVEEAHDIIHRVAAILAMEEEEDVEEENDGGGGGDAGQGSDEQLTEVPWDGTLEGEIIELKDDEVE